jgi:hypothetical protein
MSSISKLKTLLTKVKEMEDAGIKIPDNLLQGIASLAGQLESFLKDSPQKAEFNAIERRELIKNILFSLWRIFYNDIYEGIRLEHEKFRKIIRDALFEKSHSESVRKEDISTRLTQIHTTLVEQWKFPIPPPIEQICLSAGLLNSEMLYSYFEDGQSWGENPEYGYQAFPFMAQDARPLSLEEYVQYQTSKKRDGIDWSPENWCCICHELAIDEQSYDFLCNSESDTALGDEIMKMCGSMTYEEIFRLLNKKYCISEHFWIPCDSDDD